MDGVAPKQDSLSLWRKFMASVSRSVTMQRNELDPVHDRLGAAERMPLAGLVNCPPAIIDTDRDCDSHKDDQAL
jgi:hypothetical protein